MFSIRWWRIFMFTQVLDFPTMLLIKGVCAEYHPLVSNQCTLPGYKCSLKYSEKSSAIELVNQAMMIFWVNWYFVGPVYKVKSSELFHLWSTCNDDILLVLCEKSSEVKLIYFIFEADAKHCNDDICWSSVDAECSWPPSRSNQCILMDIKLNFSPEGGWKISKRTDFNHEGG